MISNINGMEMIDRELHLFDDYYEATDFFMEKLEEKDLVVSSFKSRIIIKQKKKKKKCEDPKCYFPSTNRRIDSGEIIFISLGVIDDE